MISILVCSVNEKLFTAFEKNVNDTIGRTCEVIRYENNDGESIFEVYNKLKHEAKGEVLCFVHEDVAFRSPNWGKELMQAFSNPNVGLVGVAGTLYKPSIPTGWYINDQYAVTHLIQNTKDGKNPVDNMLNFDDEAQEKLVSSIDGVFMAVPKYIADKISFNTSLDGFHAYDTDLSMAVVAQGLGVYVTNRILIEHFSGGSPNAQWLHNHIETNKRWRHLLPLQVRNGIYVKEPIVEVDNQAQWYFVDCMHKFSFSTFFKLKNVLFFNTKHTQQRTFNFVKSMVLNWFK